jgi:hypothetical protein
MTPFVVSFLLEDLKSRFVLSITRERRGGSLDFLGSFDGSIEEYRRMFSGFKSV